jgi:ribosome-associated protein
MAARTALKDKMGRDVVVRDVRGRSPLMDYVVVATGASAPQIKAMAAETQRVLKGAGAACYRHAGTPEGGWMVLDYVDCVTHIFSPEARAYYAIEDLWPEAPLVTET